MKGGFQTHDKHTRFTKDTILNLTRVDSTEPKGSSMKHPTGIPEPKDAKPGKRHIISYTNYGKKGQTLLTQLE